MSALHKSLDETLAAIREEHAREMQECKDRTREAEVRATILQDQLDKAVEARAAAERLSVKLITQFGTVEAIFAEAKELALAAFHEEPKVAKVPVNEMEIN
jgi:hypothetical protein